MVGVAWSQPESRDEIGEETDSNRTSVLSSQSERSSDGGRYMPPERRERQHLESANGRNHR